MPRQARTRQSAPRRPPSTLRYTRSSARERPQVKRWIADLAAKDFYQKLAACANIRKYASTSAENAATVAALGGIPRLVSAARSDRALYGPAAATLRVMSSDYSNHATIAIAGGIPLMVDMLRSVPSVCEHAMHALSDLSRYVENRVTMASAGAIPLLISALTSATATSTVRCSLAATLGNLGSDAGNASIVAEVGGIAPLISMLRSSSVDMVRTGTDAMLRLSAHADLRGPIAAARGVIPLVALLDAPHTSLQAQQTAACVLKNLSENDDTSISALVAAGALPVLMGHLLSDSVMLQVAAASTIRNVCARANRPDFAAVPTIHFVVGTDGFRVRVDSEITGEIPRFVVLLDNVLAHPGAHSEDILLAAVDALRRLSASSSRIRDLISSTALPPLLGLLTAHFAVRSGTRDCGGGAVEPQRAYSVER